VGFGIGTWSNACKLRTRVSHIHAISQEHRSPPNLPTFTIKTHQTPDDGIISDSVKPGALRAKAGDAGLGESEAGTWAGS
jgi:hypothetical protein